MPYEKEIDVARRAAGLAAGLALRHQRAGLHPETKPDGSPVTIADRENERLIAGMLEEAFPLDGLLGEEGSRKESRSGRRWIIDPIDGTRDFVRGNPLWAVLIGLEVDGNAVAGVTHLPLLGHQYFAGRGAGAWRDGERLQVSGIDSAASAVACVNGLNRVGCARFRDRLIDWMESFSAVRSLGGAADAMLLATGQVDVWIEPKAEIWDLAPLQVIIEEAGGSFFDFSGSRGIAGGNAVACTPGLEPAVRRLLG